MRAIRTGKLGWLYLAHPDFTHRGEVEEVLKPIIQHYFQEPREIQAVPEMEVITIQGVKTQQRVLALRGSYEEIDEMRDCLMAVFEDDSEYNLGFLARYCFISSSPVATCTWDHLHKILIKQQNFHKQVQWL